jgi:hypothetical protein
MRALVDDGVSSKAEVDQVFRCVPAPFGVENDQQEITSVLGDLGNEAPASLGSKAGFDAFDAGDSAKEPIRVVKYVGSIAIDRHDNRVFFAN